MHNVVQKMCLTISDPWEIGESVEWRSFTCEYIDHNEQYVLFRLDEPFAYKGKLCEYFRASPRYADSNIKQLFDGQAVYCGICQVSREIVESGNPFRRTMIKGGIAMIGELKPL